MVTYSGMASFSLLLLQLWRGYKFISMSIYPSVVTLCPIGRVSETMEFVRKQLTQDAEILGIQYMSESQNAQEKYYS